MIDYIIGGIVLFLIIVWAYLAAGASDWYDRYKYGRRD